jgi:starch synthase
VDLVLEVIEDLVTQPAQVVILGSGDRHYEIECRRLARDFPEEVSVTIDYDTALAHLIQAGSDLFLMPSRFEPCGLSQFCSMRYGTVPIAHRTGGLADSVVDTQPRTLADGTATGFLFENANRAELLACILRALLVYRDQRTWQRIQQHGMRQSFGWDQRALEYLKLYRALVPVRHKARV